MVSGWQYGENLKTNRYIQSGAGNSHSSSCYLFAASDNSVQDVELLVFFVHLTSAL